VIIREKLLSIPSVISEFGEISSFSLNGGEASANFNQETPAQGTCHDTLQGTNDSGILRVAWRRDVAAREIQVEIFRTYSDLPPNL